MSWHLLVKIEWKADACTTGIILREAHNCAGTMKSRKFRRKVVAEDDDEAEDGDNMSMAVPPSSLGAREKEKQREKKRSEAGKVRLSFGDDEEGQAAVAAKKAGKLRPSGVQSTALPTTDAKPTTQTSGAGACSPTERFAPTLWYSTGEQSSKHVQRVPAGEYTAERLKELQGNALRMPSAKPAAKPAPESIFKLSGSFKSASAPKDDRFDASTAVVRMCML